MTMDYWLFANEADCKTAAQQADALELQTPDRTASGAEAPAQITKRWAQPEQVQGGWVLPVRGDMTAPAGSTTITADQYRARLSAPPI